MLFKCRFRYEPEEFLLQIDAPRARDAAKEFAKKQFPSRQAVEELDYGEWERNYDIIVTSPSGKIEIYGVLAEQATNFIVCLLPPEYLKEK